MLAGGDRSDVANDLPANGLQEGTARAILSPLQPGGELSAHLELRVKQLGRPTLGYVLVGSYEVHAPCVFVRCWEVRSTQVDVRALGSALDSAVASLMERYKLSAPWSKLRSKKPSSSQEQAALRLSLGCNLDMQELEHVIHLIKPQFEDVCDNSRLIASQTARHGQKYP